jgi:hypothetical protein
VSGPVAAGASSAWAVTGGVLQAIAGAKSTSVATERPASCVGSFEGAPYVCEQTWLLGLGPSGPEDPLYDLSSLRGPAPDNEPAYAEQNCDLQWDVFRYDLTRAGITVMSDAGADASTDRGASGGCAIARAPGDPISALGFVLSGLVVLKRRGSRARLVDRAIWRNCTLRREPSGR